MHTEPNSAPAPVLRDREYERIFLTGMADLARRGAEAWATVGRLGRVIG